MIFQQAPGWWIIGTKGWAVNSSPSFSMDGKWKRRSVHLHALVVLCTFSIWALTLNVVPWAKAMMNFPSWQLPLFQRSTQYERVGAVCGQKPHVKWEAAKWIHYSSSSGPVVLEGWLLWATAKNCKPGNTSVQLGSLYGIQTLQHVETCELGTKREIKRENREWQAGKKENRGFVMLLTPDRSQNFFSPSALSMLS